MTNSDKARIASIMRAENRFFSEYGFWPSHQPYIAALRGWTPDGSWNRRKDRLAGRLMAGKAGIEPATN